MSDNKMTAEQAIQDFEEYVAASGGSDVWAMNRSHAIRQALSAPRVPDGWKLVPVEPTEDMMFASFDATYGQADTRSIYTAMLAASPEPVVEQSIEQPCKHCGGKTMHVGDVCYSCSNQPENEAEPKGCLSLNKLCTYPDCKCPFDMGSENNCLREGDPS